MSIGQWKPVLLAWCSMTRWRDCEPAPQDLLHADHTEYSETSQWMGHSPSEQGAFSVRSGQDTPPYSAGTTIRRSRRWMPSPQDAEHVLHLYQCDVTQFTGHGCVLQLSICVEALQPLPPNTE